MTDKEKLQIFAKEFGIVVRKARLFANLTQEELAHKVDSTRAAIIRIELGQATYMPASRALEICEALDTSLTEIWRDMNVYSIGAHNRNE
jgi:DNA-binding XRE family transcriptional regulator